MDNATEELIKQYNEPDKVPCIKSFGEFNKQYVIKDIWTGSNEKKVKPPFDGIYNLLRFFHPKTKPVLWWILIEQLYLYNAIIEVYKIRENPDHQNYQDAIEELRKNKPIKRLPEEQLNNFKGIQEDQLNDLDNIEQWIIDVEKHLSDQPELKKLIDIKASPVSE